MSSSIRHATSILIDHRGLPVCSEHGRTVQATGDTRPGGAALYRCTAFIERDDRTRTCGAARWVGV